VAAELTNSTESENSDSANSVFALTAEEQQRQQLEFDAHWQEYDLKTYMGSGWPDKTVFLTDCLPGIEAVDSDGKIETDTATGNMPFDTAARFFFRKGMRPEWLETDRERLDKYSRTFLLIAPDRTSIFAEAYIGSVRVPGKPGDKLWTFVEGEKALAL